MHVPARAPSEHTVHFYDSDQILCAAAADFLAAGAREREHLLIIATPSRARNLEQALKDRGIDAGAAGLTVLDAEKTLAQFMAGDLPDGKRFEETVGAAMRTASAGGDRRVRAYGEMVDVLWQSGRSKAAILLEEMWNELASRHAFALYCAYAIGSFFKRGDLHDICSAHDRVFPIERDAGGAAPSVDTRALLSEIAERKRIEGALRDCVKELRGTEASLRDFVENAPVGLHGVGADGEILWANAAELEMLGYERSEYVGHHIAEFHVDRAVIAEILEKLRRQETIRDREARLRAKDGSIKHVLITSNAHFERGELVSTRCFTRDITARRDAEEAARRNEDELRRITDVLPALMARVDREQRYRSVNEAYERWFGVPRASILEKRLIDFLGEEAYAGLREHVERALAGQQTTFETRLSYRLGGVRFVEATYMPYLAAGGEVDGFVALVIDVTERKRNEEARARAAKRAELLARLTGTVSNAVTRSEVFVAIVDGVVEALEASSGALWMVCDDQRAADLVRAAGYSERAQQMLRSVPLDAGGSIPAIEALRSGQPIWIDSQQELLDRFPQVASLAAPGRTYRIACLPVVVHERILGSLGFTFENAGSIDQEERDFLQVIARDAGQAIERLRLFEAEAQARASAEESSARLAVLNRVSRTIAELGADRDAVLEAVAREVLSAGAQACSLLLIAEDGESLELAVLHHRDPESARAGRAAIEIEPAKVGQGLSGRVAKLGETLLISDVGSAEVMGTIRPEHHAWLKQNRLKSVMIVPLRSRGRVLGTLSALREEGAPSFEPEDRQLLEELAERAAIAIETASLYRENERARIRAEMLYNLARALIEAQTIDEVYEAALNAIEQSLGAERSAILTFDQHDAMRFNAWRGLSDEYRSAVEGHSPWPRGARDAQPIFISDVSQEPTLSSYLPLFHREDIGSLGFFPLLASGELCGKFMVYYRHSKELTSQDFELARAIANHVAAAVSRFSATRALEQTVRFNEMFTAVLGHDLRNPLAAILTAAQVALMRGEDDRVLKPIARILRSSERMTRMIDQLLDFTRVRVGSGIPLRSKRIDLLTVVEQAVEELDGSNPECSLHLEHQGDTEGVWDADRVSQIFSNLIANALQHGVPAAGVHVRVDGADSEVVRVDVHNLGAVPEDMMATLFEPLTGGARRNRKSHGLGLGLFISQRIAEAHGGGITVRSNLSEGTTFTVVLPRTQGEGTVDL